MLTYLVNNRARRKMKVYHFPPITLNRLVREAVSGFYLLRIKFPDPDRPFTALDPATMP